MKIKVLLFFLICAFSHTVLYAYDFVAGGLAYNILKDGSVSVTCKNPDAGVNNADGGYSGNIVVPAAVKYKGRTYKVTEIGEKAFFSNHKLLSVKLPEGIRKIGYHAFGYIDNLKKIYIPSNVSTIVPGFAFGSRNLGVIEVSPKNKHYVSRNNCLYNKSMTRLVLVSPKTRRYTFPPSVKYVEDYAFSGVLMRKLVVPKTVIAIGGNSFFCIRDIAVIDNKTTLKKLPGSGNYNRNLDLPPWAYQPCVWGK